MVEVTDKWGTKTERGRGYYSVGEKSKHNGCWGWQTIAGGREKEDFIWQVKEQTWLSCGEVHSLRRADHSISYSVSHLQRTFKKINVSHICWSSVCIAYKVKVQKIDIFTVSKSVTHSKPFSKRFYRFVVCCLISWLVFQCSFIRQLFVRCFIADRCNWTLAQQVILSLCFEWLQ